MAESDRKNEREKLREENERERMRKKERMR
jgi:hypothetical protein